MSLNGSQRQRLAIARALFWNSLIDKATRAHDSETNHLTQDALSKATKGRLAITIVDRLSTIENADYINLPSKGSFYK